MLRVPGVITVYLASMIGRLPSGAVGLLLILRTRELTGSYAAGGAVAGAYSLALGASAPLLGRIVDRRGQGAVLVISALAGSACLLAFAALGDGAPTGAALAIAAVTGIATPPLNSCQRALWTRLEPASLRHTAFAVDSAMFELVYIVGPLALIGGVGAVSLRAAIATAAGCTLLGTLAFAATRLSRNWRPEGERPADPLGPLRGAGVRVIIATVALFALGLGSVEVGLAAFAGHHGHKETVGILLSLWGVGSMAGGIVAARTPAPADPTRRLTVLLLALAALELPLAFVHSLPAMAVAITIAGIGISPCLGLLFSLTGEVAPPGTVTEALTWVSSAVAAGLAAGSALGGYLVDHSGTTAVLLTVAGYGVAAAAVIASRPAALATT